MLPLEAEDIVLLRLTFSCLSGCGTSCVQNNFTSFFWYDRNSPWNSIDNNLLRKKIREMGERRFKRAAVKGRISPPQKLIGSWPSPKNYADCLHVRTGCGGPISYWSWAVIFSKSHKPKIKTLISSSSNKLSTIRKVKPGFFSRPGCMAYWCKTA